MEISSTAGAGAASGTASASQLPGCEESDPKAISHSVLLEPSEVPLMKPGQLFYQNKSQTGFRNDLEQGS